MSSFNTTVEEAIKVLSESDKKFVELIQHGSMKVEYYAPEKIDLQTPHQQDELYIIISGNGKFVRDNETVNFKPHDVLFVPACMKHRFTDFSDDFATWVIFYGNDSGK